MKLIPITRVSKETLWINPEYVINVQAGRIGEWRKTTGTLILMRAMNILETPEDIESVLNRLQGGA